MCARFEWAAGAEHAVLNIRKRYAFLRPGGSDTRKSMG
jgi:hypothetical protein